MTNNFSMEVFMFFLITRHAREIGHEVKIKYS